MRTEPRTYQATASVGACMAGLAIPDAVAVLHGGAGCEVRLHTLLHRHDPSGSVHARFTCTKIGEAALVLDPGAVLVPAVRDAVERLGARLAVVTSASFVEAAGLDHEHLRAELARTLTVPVVYVVAPDFDGDLFDGYARALAELAGHFSRGDEQGSERAGRVNLVGYLLDRPFGEHEGNLSEARRLLEAVGLRLNVTMLGGAASSRLRLLGDAEVNVTLPGGKRAAGVLSEALGQPSTTAPLPIGLADTEAWLMAIALATGREARARSVCAQERDRVRGRVRQACEPLTGRRVAIFADGAKLHGLVDTCRALRLVPTMVGVLDGRVERARLDEWPELERLDDPSLREVDERLARAGRDGELDVVIGTATEASMAARAGIAALEVGFPCHRYLPLVPSPYWGYEGVLLLATRLLEALGRRG